MTEMPIKPPARVVCPCGESVDDEPVSKARHLLYSCRRASEEQRTQAAEWLRSLRMEHVAAESHPPIVTGKRCAGRRNPEREARIRELWGKGMGQSQIARAEGITRASVYDWLHRLGLKS